MKTLAEMIAEGRAFNPPLELCGTSTVARGDGIRLPWEPSAFFWRPSGNAKARRMWRRRDLPNSQRQAKTGGQVTLAVLEDA